jgi:hypothetical protein
VMPLGLPGDRLRLNWLGQELAGSAVLAGTWLTGFRRQNSASWPGAGSLSSLIMNVSAFSAVT